MRSGTGSAGDRVQHGDGLVNAPPIRFLFATWLLLLVVGCDGCRREPTPEDEAAKSERDKPPLVTASPKAFPTTRIDAGTRGAIDGAVKPGHWTGASVELQSNRDNRRGTIRTTVTAKRLSNNLPDLSDLDAKPSYTTVDQTESIPVSRPAVLPKGQKRRLDTRLFVPDFSTGPSGRIELGGNFLATTTTLTVDLQPAVFLAMPPETYFFVVLTERPERFARLQTADWAAPLRDASLFESGRVQENYRIVVPPTEGVPPLAETALDWTSTAVLLWDDLAARGLTPNQRTALADWVRMGGTLIVNGPIAASALGDDEISSWLPIQNDGNAELDPQSTVDWLQSLSVPSDPSVAAIAAQLADGTARVVLTGKVRPGSESIGRGEMVVQARVGHGRVVQSRVDLLSDWLVAWNSYDSFVNGGVLGRPPRRVLKNDPSVIRDVEDMQTLSQSFVGQSTNDTAPSINSGLRIFARDARLMFDSQDESTPTEPNPAEAAMSVPTEGSLANWTDATIQSHPISGVGGWKENSDVLQLFQKKLAGQIGVTIPKSSLIVRALAIYLVLLIPINYLVFRLVGRLEWAWLAIIPISLIGAVVVARVAQLDVGFVRSRNELALLEMHSGYPRGHLTRIVGLYNSLSSSYTIQFESPDAAITVIESQRRDDTAVNVFGREPVMMTIGVEAGPTLSGVTVGSNSFAALHTEQFLSLGGSIDVQDDRLFNRTKLDLLDAFVVRCDVDGKVEVAAVGGLDSGDQSKLDFRDSDQVKVPSELPLGATEILQRMMSSSSCPRGTTRLVGRVSMPLGEMTIQPDCSQVRGETIVLVHLQTRPLPPVSIDENLISDLKK